MHDRTLGSKGVYSPVVDSKIRKEEQVTIADAKISPNRRPSFRDYRAELIGVSADTLRLFDNSIDVLEKISSDIEEGGLDVDTIISFSAEVRGLRDDLEESRTTCRDYESTAGISNLTNQPGFEMAIDLDNNLSNIFDKFTEIVKGLVVSIGVCPDCITRIPSGTVICPDCEKPYGTQDASKCPKCGLEVTIHYDYCPKCDYCLPDMDAGVLTDSQSTAAFAAELIREHFEEVREYILEFFVFLGRVIHDHDMRVTLFEWEYCPCCGGRHTVWQRSISEKDVGKRGDPYCLLCESEWETIGIFRKKLKINSPNNGKINGESYTKDEWRKSGAENHDAKAFKNYHEVWEDIDFSKFITYIEEFVI